MSLDEPSVTANTAQAQAQNPGDRIGGNVDFSRIYLGQGKFDPRESVIAVFIRCQDGG